MTEEKNKPLVAFLGPNASYTHQATLDSFDEHDYNFHPCISIEDVFAAVQSGTATHGVVPFENSSNGSVVFTLDLFADIASKYPDILVCGEAYIAVQHCLLGNPKAHAHAAPKLDHHGLGSVIESPQSSGAVTPTTKVPTPEKPRARPLADFSSIRKLYSHPQAWGQCKAFLDTYLKGVERQDVSSTSRAAELVSQDESGTVAAVSSGIAGRLFGLSMLAKGIEDRGDNTTRFFVLRRKDVSSSSAGSTASAHLQGSSMQSGGAEDEQTDRWKTLVSFTVNHSNPGSLASSLSVFSTYGLNITSINTRPSGVENWNYIFFVEIKGRKLEGESEGPVNKALKDLGQVCRGWRWLGSWENKLLGAGQR